MRQTESNQNGIAEAAGPGEPLPSPEIRGAAIPGSDEILVPGALRFIAALSERFEGRRQDLLSRRAQIQDRIRTGLMPDFLPDTADLRASSWTIDPVPPILKDRRVEITGPACDTKMVINALNSGANVYMADFEDAQSPTWENAIRGQVNVRNAIRRTIHFETPEGKTYRLNSSTATLMVRPRGWHLAEKHLLVSGNAISASLFDFGLFAWHNAALLAQRGTGPFLYLPKLENHLEARLWSDVLAFTETWLDVPRGCIKATVLIETILAAFEMDEILFELREHSSGLNCGRWDYIFSFIKKFRFDPTLLLPDRSQVTMDKGFLSAYVKLLIRTCHRRGAHAMGGMAAQIPIKNDEEANQAAVQKVRADKIREVTAGHDGTWVAHPALVPVAKAVFDEHMRGPHQIGRPAEGGTVTSRDLLSVPEGSITERGLRTNVDVAIQYMESWLRGTGAVPLYHLMEDAATAEISRAQVWQWLHHGARLADGRRVNAQLVRTIIDEEVGKMRALIGSRRFDGGEYVKAAELFRRIAMEEPFTEFLTQAAYEYL